MGLKDIVENNHYPIVFIGSGMERRYLKGFPNWNDLLKMYWNKIGEPGNFYSFLHELTSKHREADKATQDFFANSEAAGYIQQKFDKLFYNEKITVNGLSIQAAQQNRISPFKQSIANLLRNYTLRDDIDFDELKAFVHVLEKAKMIITTNYDTFIQDMIKKDSQQHPSVFVGQSGLFDSNDGISEIYQIHGSVLKPKSIVINSNDYKSFDKNSILVSAKIMVSMIDTPIIFFGYSMTDRNIRKVLEDFGSQLPQEDPRKSANRIFVVDRKKGQNDISEQIVSDPSLNQLTYTLLKTDNYKEVFKKLSKINEGASPYEIKKFNGLIKKLIIQRGQKGKLDSVLVNPTQLNNISKEIDEGKPIVVALGNEKYFYVYPDLISYIKDYFEETNNYAPAVALSFAANDGNRKTKTPFSRYLHNVDFVSLNLHSRDIKKLNNKINNSGTLEKVISSIPKYDKMSFNSIANIKSKKLSSSKLFNVLTYNIAAIPLPELDLFVKNEALKIFVESVKKGSGLTSRIRKFLFAYDLRKNGELTEIKRTIQSPIM